MPILRDRMIPIMITRFTLSLKKEVGNNSTWDEDIFISKSFSARAPTPHDSHDDPTRRSADLETA